METLYDIKVGDTAIVEDGYGHWYYVQAEKVTKEQIQINQYTKFWKKNGREVGGIPYRSSTIYPLTDEWIQQTEEHKAREEEILTRNRLVSKIRDVRLKSIPIPVLQQISQLIDEALDK